MTLMKHNKGETYEQGMELTWPKYASFKLDGIRVSGQNDTLITNAGKEIANRALIEKFAPLVQGLDGELICGEPNAPDVYNKTFSAVMRKHNTSVEGVKFYCFDTLHTNLPFAGRLMYLQALDPMEDVVVLEQTPVFANKELDDFYATALEQGYEGTILRNPTAIYKQGRSTLVSQDLLKIKPFADAEFTVGEIYEAETNNNEATLDAHGHTVRSSHAENKVGNGMLGGFHATWTNGLPFKIAPGTLTHKERIDILRNPAKYRGRIGVYRYMTYGIVDVPRHGRFKGWRDASDIT